MTPFKRFLDIAVNVAILIVACCFVVLVYRSFHTPKSGRLIAANSVKPGDVLPFLNSIHGAQSLVLVLQKDCTFCKHSVPFYRHLADELKSKHTNLYFVLPSNLHESKNYLRENQLPTDNVIQQPLEAISVPGTPTLILANQEGRIRAVWVGQLTSGQEQEVEKALK